jgi:hypothetical protein
MPSSAVSQQGMIIGVGDGERASLSEAAQR